MDQFQSAKQVDFFPLLLNRLEWLQLDFPDIKKPMVPYTITNALCQREAMRVFATTNDLLGCFR